MFAVIGTLYDPSGDAQTCIAGQHHRVLLTFDLTQAIIDKSPAGLIVNAGSNPERLVRVLLELLAKRGTLKGRTVGVLGDTASAATVNGTILPGLKKLGVTLGTTGLLTISGSDTTAAQSQLDSFIERWKTEHVDTVFLSGYAASSVQFVTKLRKELPNLLLLSDNGQVLGDAQQLKHAGVTPNPYEGLITAGGQTQSEYANGPNWKYCKDIYKQETGKDAPDANDVIPYKGSKTQTLDTYGSINDACQLVTMFHDIGQRVGPDLNNTNWVNTVNTYGPITNRGSGPYSSLTKGNTTPKTTGDSNRSTRHSPRTASSDQSPPSKTSPADRATRIRLVDRGVVCCDPEYGRDPDDAIRGDGRRLLRRVSGHWRRSFRHGTHADVVVERGARLGRPVRGSFLPSARLARPAHSVRQARVWALGPCRPKGDPNRRGVGRRSHLGARRGRQ